MIVAHTKNGDIQLRCNQLFSNGSYVPIENTAAIDLVNIFLEIYVGDIGNKRVGNRPRNISITAYVDEKNYVLWKKNSQLIEQLAEFVTEGDKDGWEINLEACTYSFEAQQMTLRYSALDNISLISGGLDSYCGAYYNEKEEQKTLYCGYKTSNVDTSAINSVSTFLQNRKGNLGTRSYARVSKNKKEYTQRTRSLLFFSLAVLTAIKEKIDIVKVNENGIMSLNPSFQTRGTTKTTHPKTIYLYQLILDNIGINVKIQHPFLFMTKGEMVNSLSLEYKKNIKNTRSCSRSMHDPRYDTSGQVSCGACVPCLLRKISMAAYDMEEYDNEYVIPYTGDDKDEEYLSALNYFKRFSKSIKEKMIFPELVIRKKFYSSSDYYERTQDMLNKFSREVESFIKKYGG